MADLGLHAFPDAPDGVEWSAHEQNVLETLPSVFSTVWISDHLLIDDDPWPEAWTRLTYMAAAFPRYRFGHLVLSQSYRNPGLLGCMAATLQNLTGGRFILGLGAGWAEEEYRAFGYDYPSGGTRVDQLAETIQLVKTLWTESPATFHGEWYHLENARCEIPVAPIPVLVGTHGRKAIKVVAQHADWWAWDGPWEPGYREPYERLRAECEAIGRPFDDITLVAELTISMPDDTATFEPTYTNETAYPGQVFGVVGPTPADVIREIERLVDAGVKHLPVHLDTMAELQRFIDEVVPNVRLEPAG